MATAAQGEKRSSPQPLRGLLLLREREAGRRPVGPTAPATRVSRRSAKPRRRGKRRTKRRSAGGADWQIVRASGSSVADIRYTLKTDGGAMLYVQSQGVRHGDPDVLARLAAGEDVDPSEYTFRTSVTIETADPELAWVNDGVFIAVGGRRPSGVSYDVYLVA